MKSKVSTSMTLWINIIQSQNQRTVCKLAFLEVTAELWMNYYMCAVCMMMMMMSMS